MIIRIWCRPGSARTLPTVVAVGLLSLCAAIVVLVGAAAPAAAHNVLLSRDPAAGGTVDRAPATVILTFDEPCLALGTEVSVLGPTGDDVRDGRVSLIDNTVRQPLRGDLPAGVYTVDWRVTSVDGHPVSGRYTFTTRQRSAPRASTPEPAPTANGAGSADIALVVGVIGAVVVLGVVSGVVVRRRRSRQSPGRDDPAI